MMPMETIPFHGERGDAPVEGMFPRGLTIAISREAGARGGSVARRVGSRLGWQVYTQELLEFLCANEAARESILADVPKEASDWVTHRLARIRDERPKDVRAEHGEMPRLILTLAARGNVLLVGRGAGYYLPRESSLHVRIIAPLVDRVAHMADWLRLTGDQAAEQVKQRDARRAEFLFKNFGRRISDLQEFDLVLNSGLLGEETCADLIAAALQGKMEQTEPDSRLL